MPPTTLDGTSYAFLNLARGAGRHWSGRTSNPPPGSRPNLLAQIGEDVIAYVQADAAAAPALLAKVDAALGHLAASLPR